MTGRRELWEVTRFSGQRRGFVPQCDCYRTDDPPALHLVLELPGVDPAAVQIVAVGTTLVVSGVRERPHPTAARYHQVEIEYGPFERRIELAEDVDADRAAATYEAGMLRLEVPLAMSEIEFTETAPAQVDEIPAELPVLPLKETVVFPDSMTPLAIGQERSIRLVDDVVGGERLLALVTVRDAGRRGTRLGRPVRDRDGGGRAQDDPRPRRDAADPRPGPPPHPVRGAVTDDPYLVARFAPVPDEAEESRELEALLRNGQGLFGRIIGLAPYLPEELQIAAANVGDACGALQSRCLDAPAQDRREAADSRARRHRGAAARGLEDPQPGARGVRARHEDPVAGAVGAREGPARVLPPPAAEGDSGGARRRRSRAGRRERAARAARRARASGGRAKGGRPRARTARAATGGGGRVRRHPRVPRLARDAAVERDDARRPRPRPCAPRSSTRITTTSRR